MGKELGLINVFGEKSPEFLSPSRALVIFAHPDDGEINCGGTVSLLNKRGVEIAYVACTDGSKGTWDSNMRPTELIQTRANELKSAAEMLGVNNITLLNFEDGKLQSFQEKLKRELALLIREFKPQVIFTHDPWKLYEPNPDHVATGFATVHAAMAASGPLFYPEQITESRKVHFTPTLALFNTNNPNFVVDISDVVDTKVNSIRIHVSQFGPRERFLQDDLMKQFADEGAKHEVTYAEAFHILTLK